MALVGVTVLEIPNSSKLTDVERSLVKRKAEQQTAFREVEELKRTCERLAESVGRLWKRVEELEALLSQKADLPPKENSS
jgi:hypothetical protein